MTFICKVCLVTVRSNRLTKADVCYYCEQTRPFDVKILRLTEDNERLRKALEYADEIIEDQAECRGDEDCDHCEYKRTREALKVSHEQ